MGWVCPQTAIAASYPRCPKQCLSACGVLCGTRNWLSQQHDSTVTEVLSLGTPNGPEARFHKLIAVPVSVGGPPERPLLFRLGGHTMVQSCHGPGRGQVRGIPAHPMNPALTGIEEGPPQGYPVSGGAESWCSCFTSGNAVSEPSTEKSRRSMAMDAHTGHRASNMESHIATSRRV